MAVRGRLFGARAAAVVMWYEHRNPVRAKIAGQLGGTVRNVQASLPRNALSCGIRNIRNIISLVITRIDADWGPSEERVRAKGTSAVS